MSIYIENAEQGMGVNHPPPYLVGSYELVDFKVEYCLGVVFLSG